MRFTTKSPTAGGLISNRIASSLSDMPYSFTAQYHKLFPFTYITYFFSSVPIPTQQPLSNQLLRSNSK